MKQLTFLCFLLGSFTFLKAQTDPLTQSHGARSQSLGNLRINLIDTWAFFNNVGGLDRIENSEVAVGYNHRFGLKELSTFNLVGAWKNKYGTLGFGAFRFGATKFNQQTLGIGYSNQIGIVSLGLKAEWFQTQIEGFGTGNAVLLHFGGVAELGPKFFFGAHISNINRAKISKNSQERLPTAIQMGITYRPVETLSIYLETEKDIAVPPALKAGLEYGIKDWLYLRSGINTNPARLFFGFGLRPKGFKIDYGFGQNSALGSTNHISLAILWNEN